MNLDYPKQLKMNTTREKILIDCDMAYLPRHIKCLEESHPNMTQYCHKDHLENVLSCARMLSQLIREQSVDHKSK